MGTTNLPLMDLDITGWAFVLAALFCAMATPTVRHAAGRLQILDFPSGRKIHRRPIPRLGGIAIVLGALGAPAVLALGAPSPSVLTQGLAGLAIGGGLIAAVGLVDDLRSLPPLAKLFGQVVAACITVWLGITIEVIATPWGTLSLGPAAFPATVIWIVVVVNSFNLIDGLDGLAAGVGLIAAAGMFIVAVVTGQESGSLVLAALGGALIAFLVFNFHPASIMMGDMGALFIGYILAVSAITVSAAPAGNVSFLVPALVLAVPLLDTALSVIRRGIAGQSIFRSDRGHIHHRLLARGWSVRQTVVALYAVAALFAAAAIGLFQAAGMGQSAVLGLRWMWHLYWH